MRQIFYLCLSALLFLLLFITSCQNNKYKINNFDINDLEYNELPYVGDQPISTDIAPTDSEGVYLFYYKGDKYYHPVRLCDYTLKFLDSYIQTGNAEYFRKAKLFINKMLDESIEVHGAIYFPYNYDFPLHGIEMENMKAPWVSGLAQGKALSVFTRFYRTTKQKQYLKIAKKVFRSFTIFNKKYGVVIVDEERYFWIEEYPMNNPTHVLNGFNSAIVGIYEYYLISHKKNSKKVLQASLTTIYNYISEYRNPGKISNYCLKHKISNSKYHLIHIDQLKLLYKITGEKYFYNFASLLYNDYH